MEEIVYFEINNWFAGRDYPNDEIFYKWIKDCQFRDNEWCKQNKLCVMCGAIDMSMNYCVAAPKSWVEKNCPKLLTDEEYEYKIITSGLDKETGKSLDKDRFRRDLGNVEDAYKEMMRRIIGE